MRKVIIASVYSIIHFIVDMSCSMLIAGVLTPVITSTNKLIFGIILYNLFAFAFQLPFGILADKINKNAIFSFFGCLFIIIAYIVNQFTILSCIVAGIGNALFHIGGGIDVLNISSQKASLPGIYVATGALGLYIGTKLDCTTYKSYLIIILLLLSMFALMWLYNLIKCKYKIDNEIPKFENLSNKKKIIIYCLLITICIRGYIGLILNFKWKSNFLIGMLCVCAVVLGKIIGGILGDKFGFKKISTISLLVSAFLFIFSFNNATCGVLAILLFNMTMPITLTSLSNIFYNNKGMAFGFTTLALFIGAIPVLLGYSSFLFNSTSLFIITIMSAIILYFGLNEYEKLEK